MFIPYFITDFLYFGTVQDIKKSFDIELDVSPNRTKRRAKNMVERFIK